MPEAWWTFLCSHCPNDLVKNDFTNFPVNTESHQKTGISKLKLLICTVGDKIDIELIKFLIIEAEGKKLSQKELA